MIIIIIVYYYYYYYNVVVLKSLIWKGSPLTGISIRRASRHPAVYYNILYIMK